MNTLTFERQHPKLPAFAGIFLMLFALLPTTIAAKGCPSISASTLAADGQDVANALKSIAAQVSLSNPSLADQLVTSAQTIIAITGNWQNGSRLQEFNALMDGVQVLLGAIPITAPFASLVGIAVMAVDLLVHNANPTTPVVIASPGAVRGHYIPGQPVVILHENIHRGRIQIHRSFLHPTIEGALKSGWNEQAEKVGAAKI